MPYLNMAARYKFKLLPVAAPFGGGEMRFKVAAEDVPFVAGSAPKAKGVNPTATVKKRVRITVTLAVFFASMRLFYHIMQLGGAGQESPVDLW